MTLLSEATLSKFERGFIAAFALSHLLIPLLVPDLYPWTSMPMFSSTNKRYVTYSVFEPSGSVLSPIEFGVFRKDLANTSPRIGFDLPFTVFALGAEPKDLIVREHVKRVLTGMPQLPYVELQKQTVGPLSDRPWSVGVIDEERWRIDR